MYYALTSWFLTHAYLLNNSDIAKDSDPEDDNKDQEHAKADDEEVEEGEFDPALEDIDDDPAPNEAQDGPWAAANWQEFQVDDNPMTQIPFRGPRPAPNITEPPHFYAGEHDISEETDTELLFFELFYT